MSKDNFRDIELMVQSSRFLMEGDLETAIKTANQALVLYPNDPDILGELGNYYYANQDFDKAIEYFSESLAIDSSNIDILEQLGSVYFDIKDYSSAVNQFSRVLKHEPKRIYSLLSLGEVAFALDELELAKHYFNRVIEQERDVSFFKSMYDHLKESKGTNVSPRFLVSCMIGIANEVYMTRSDICVAYLNLVSVYEFEGDKLNRLKANSSYVLSSFKNKPLEVLVNFGLKFV